MDYYIEFPRPYLTRKNPSERAIIDKRLNNELRRISRLLPIQVKNLQINSDLITEIKKISDETFNGDINLNDVSLNNKNIEAIIDKKFEINKSPFAKQKNLTTIDSNIKQRVSSDTISNNPNGTITIGYNCTIDFVTTLDFKPFSGSYETLKIYVVFEKSSGQYFFEEGYEISQFTKEKPFLQSLVKCKWTMDFNMYVGTTYPTSKLKVVVEEYVDSKKTDTIWSDVLIVNFSGQNCINIHDMGLIASNSDGGYPSIKGGDHGNEPTLFINLDSPAPPDGQTIYLEITGVTNTNPSAWINSGYSQVKINSGQTHGEWTGFVGSRKVLSTKDIHVKAKISNPIGNSIGVSTLRITRK